MRWTHWLPQFSRKITCPGFGCPIDELIKMHKANGTQSPYGSARAFSLNIYNHDTNQHEIMEEGVTMFEVLKIAIEDAIEENPGTDRKSTRLNSSHVRISYAVFCLKKKT